MSEKNEAELRMRTFIGYKLKELSDKEKDIEEKDMWTEMLSVLDSKDSEMQRLVAEASYSRNEIIKTLEAESAQLRGEVERLKQADVFCRERHIPDPHQFKSLQDKLSSQSLLIEKLRKALEKIARDSDTSGPYTPNYMCGSWEASLAKEALALLPQDEKKERR